MTGCSEKGVEIARLVYGPEILRRSSIGRSRIDILRVDSIFQKFPDQEENRLALRNTMLSEF